jgi:hypothetical protein
LRHPSTALNIRDYSEVQLGDQNPHFGAFSMLSQVSLQVLLFKGGYKVLSFGEIWIQSILHEEIPVDTTLVLAVSRRTSTQETL